MSALAFVALARYLGDGDQPMGGRYRHDATGFTVDLLLVETAPQAFIWVNSFPTSDKGEPHTQEHLLLGKGDMGRRVAGLEAMSLVESSAFTMQWRTCYHLHTIAGIDAFWNIVDARLLSMLKPDYTDEEIRREVHHFGVVEDNGALRLEEKGTVYQEMVRSFENPRRRAWRELGAMLYGDAHPLTYVSGGMPDAIRAMTAKDIRDFHAQSHHLANMGMVLVLPRDLGAASGASPCATSDQACAARTIDAALAKLDVMLTALADKQDGSRGIVKDERDIPPPRGAPAGKIVISNYPFANAGKAGNVVLAWPPVRTLSLQEEELATLFLSGLASDESSVFYKRFVGSGTRKYEFGTQDVGAWLSDDPGHPIYVTIGDVDAEHLDEAGVKRIRAAVMDEIKRFADLPPDSAEVVKFNADLSRRLIEIRRGLAKSLSSPPGFGHRGTGSGWMEYLRKLQRGMASTDKSLMLKDELAWVEAQIGKPWKPWLEKWRLFDLPYGVASRADPTLLEQEKRQRQARLDAEKARLGGDEGLRKYKREYDAKTAELEAKSASRLPAFTDAPPMTEDDQLVWEKRELPFGVPLIASTFASMTGGVAGLALNLRALPEDLTRWVGLLPALLTDVGVIENGVPVSHDQMRERMRQEILYTHIDTDFAPRGDRAELTLTAAGNTPAETERAVYWLTLSLEHPDWRVENLPRILDMLDQRAAGLRNRMLGAEEGWVNDPPAAWRHQDDPVFAHSESFLTLMHDLHRLRWLLRDPRDAAEGKQLAAEMKRLASLASRADMLAAVRAKPASAVLGVAYKDLEALLSDVPDDSLAADWKYLCGALAMDFASPATTTLAQLEALRLRVFSSDRARAYAVGSTAALRGAESALGAWLKTMPRTAAKRAKYSGKRFIAERLRSRQPGAKDPLYVALVNNNTQSGVHLHSAKATTLHDVDDASLIDYLAGNVFSGQGAHSMFMKTWAAGLAYSNGLRPGLVSGRARYYAERSPDLVQTLKFVTEQLAAAQPDPSYADYALALAFSSRVAGSFEHRGAAMAADLADGDTPEVVRAFREKLLALRKSRGDKLVGEMFKAMPRVNGRVLPGWNGAAADEPVYFVIGPDAMLDRWEAYLKAPLYRLYPRDFWLP